MKRVIYAGAQVRHLFRIVDLETGCEVQTVAADDKLLTGSPAEFAQLAENHGQTWETLRGQHETLAPVNGHAPEDARKAVAAGGSD